MKKIITILLLLMYSLAYGQQKDFSSPNIKFEISKHKIVALLPFRVSIFYKKAPVNFDTIRNKYQEQEDAINMQKNVYAYFLGNANNYTVSFQKTEKTNLLLKKADIFYNYDIISQDSICKILGVDAVIKCSYVYKNFGNKNDLLANTASILPNMVGLGSINRSTSSGALTMEIYNGTTGEMIWCFYKELNENPMATKVDLFNRMMKKVSNKFPYEK